MNPDSPSSRATRRSTGLHSALTLGLFVLILAFINYLGFKHYAHADYSQSQYYTLSPKTVAVLKQLDAPVTITTILSDRYREQVQNLLKEYQRIGGQHIVVEKIDSAYDGARAAELQKRLHFQPTDFLVIFEYKGRTRYVKQDDLFEISPTTGQAGAFKGEQQFTSAIVGVIEGTTAKVYFTAGHGEHNLLDAQSPAGFGLLNQGLGGENLETASLNLATVGDVPADAQAVVVAGPSVAFSAIEVQTLDRYLAANGKLLILLDPYVPLGLDDVLKKYSLKFESDVVLYRTLTTSGELTLPLADISQNGFSPHPITAKFASANLQLLIQNARSITLLPDDKGQPRDNPRYLLQTDADAWGWIPRDTGKIDPRQLTYNKITDIKGPMIIAAAFDGGNVTNPATKETAPGTRIVAVGCSKFLANDQVDPVSLNFFANSINWLAKKEAVLDISPKRAQEYGVSASPMQLRTIITCALLLVPGAALALGIFVWLARRK